MNCLSFRFTAIKCESEMWRKDTIRLDGEDICSFADISKSDTAVSTSCLGISNSDSAVRSHCRDNNGFVCSNSAVSVGDI